MAEKKLTAKQAAFVDEYLIDLNATQAAIRAGYSKRSAEVIGFENLRKPNVFVAIQKGMDKRAERTGITAERVIEELARIAFLDIRTLFDEKGGLLPITELPEDAARALGGIDISTDWQGSGEGREQRITSKIKTIDKKGALDLIGKHLQMFTDKIEITKKTKVEELSDDELDEYIRSRT